MVENIHRKLRWLNKNSVQRMSGKSSILSQLQSFRAEYLHLSRARYSINQSIVTEFASLVSQFKRLPL